MGTGREQQPPDQDQKGDLGQRHDRHFDGHATQRSLGVHVAVMPKTGWRTVDAMVSRAGVCQRALNGNRVVDAGG